MCGCGCGFGGCGAPGGQGDGDTLQGARPPGSQQGPLHGDALPLLSPRQHVWRYIGHSSLTGRRGAAGGDPQVRREAAQAQRRPDHHLRLHHLSSAPTVSTFSYRQPAQSPADPCHIRHINMPPARLARLMGNKCTRAGCRGVHIHPVWRRHARHDTWSGRPPGSTPIPLASHSQAVPRGWAWSHSSADLTTANPLTSCAENYGPDVFK